MNKRKIFNDPVYGFITIDFEILFDLIEHPVFQRLRRIRQLGLTHLIYPGANHTRFHHALGAMHLVRLAIRVLRSKGVEINDQEAEGCQIAILLHDIGHGPFSHALEGMLVDSPHEEISLRIMRTLNQEFNGKLDVAIEIFTNEHPKQFLHELISSQLDMDRLDYLTRDSFYSGVVEGRIGYDRIIKMLNVAQNRLVVEAKGIYSVESFLMARKIMYWQVYLHKTVLAAECMIIKAIERARTLHQRGLLEVHLPVSLQVLFEAKTGSQDDMALVLHHFTQLDDYDIIVFLKNCVPCKDLLLSTLASGLIQRKLFTVQFSKSGFESDYLEKTRQKIVAQYQIDQDSVDDWLIEGQETVHFYNPTQDQIRILLRSGDVINLSDFADDIELEMQLTKKYLCFPKMG
ncbi:MAG: HD domain-containing protein [Saprospiraceae bacterium]|nr:HD domain-containing protein [Saprospiraceae bacterium]